MRREEYHAYAFMSCFKSCCLWYFLGFTNSCSLCSTKWGRTFRIEVHVASVCRISCDSEYTALLMYAHVLTALVHAVPSRRCQGAPACRLHPELRSPSPTASRMLHVPRPIVLSLSRMPYSVLRTHRWKPLHHTHAPTRCFPAVALVPLKLTSSGARAAVHSSTSGIVSLPTLALR